MYTIKYKDINHLIEKKLTHDVGVLIYQYLNDIEDNIQNSLNANVLINFYNLKNTVKQNRCICPFHIGADNPTSLVFDDNKKSFICYACNEHGTYLEFIAKMQGFTKNRISEAKIFAANNFANMNLGFDSISDFESKLKELILDRYNQTKSLILNDYYDISLIDYQAKNTKKKSVSNLQTTQNNNCNNLTTNIKEFKLEMLDIEAQIRELNADAVRKNGDFSYRISIKTAKNSKLINDFLTKPNLNSKEKLYDFMYKKYDIPKEFADKYGLICFEKSNQSLLEYPDFFTLSDRILFPFKDHETGIVVGYQARTMDLNAKNKVKYINITDFGNLKTKNNKTYRSIIPFNIGDFLFNLNELKNKNINKLFITEGVADTIKLTSLGYNSVSSGQANLTDHQIYLISKYFGKNINIYLFFDNDTNNVGQNNSIKIAYRLYQFGFTNISIVRTYAELGTDITDVAVKVRNDDILKFLIELWIKDAYKFEPASNELLNILYQTGLYSDTEILEIDPRNIKKICENGEIFKEIVTNLKLQGKEIATFKSILNEKKELLELLNDKINKLIKLNLKDKNSNEKSKQNSNIPSILPEKTLQNDWNSIDNISKKQLNILKKKFDYETVKKINDFCTKKQIRSIIGNIIENKPFDVNDYLHFNKNFNKSIDYTTVDNDFRPIINDDDCPF